ncbi:unnamed protein product [Chrysoparadoxa australica]
MIGSRLALARAQLRMVHSSAVRGTSSAISKPAAMSEEPELPANLTLAVAKVPAKYTKKRRRRPNIFGANLVTPVTDVETKELAELIGGGSVMEGGKPKVSLFESNIPGEGDVEVPVNPSMTVPVIKFGLGEEEEQIDLDKKVFGCEIRRDVVLDVIRWQRAKRRSGTAVTKTKAQVSGSNRKLRPQKGSGHARMKTRKVSQFRGGAKAHGSKKRDWSFKLNKKVVKMGLRVALSAKLLEGRLEIVNSFDLPSHKTAYFMTSLAARRWDEEQVLFIDGEEVGEKFKLGSRNVTQTKVLPVRQANVYDVIKYPKVVLCVEAVKALEERLQP